MRSSVIVNLLVTGLLAFFTTACAARITGAPVVVSQSTATPTIVITPPPTSQPENLPTGAPTITPTIEICQTSRVRAIPIYDENDLLKSFQTTDEFVVLTIDDGYNDEVLNNMLDILKENDGRATFFLVGTSFVNKIQYETFERLIENGNDIAYHSHSHPDVPVIDNMTLEDWLNDYQDWSKALKALIGEELYERGVTPYVRAPWGRWTPEFMKATNEQGFFPVYWSADEHTFEVNRMPLRAGSILILHIIPENLDELEQLMETDWQVISLRDALGETCK